MSVSDIIKRIANAALKVINDLIPKDTKSVFLFPNEGGAVDGYNITNYNSDNVLCLANSLLKDENYNSYQLYIVYFLDEELSKCKEYVQQYHPKRVHFVKFKLDMNFFKAYSKCKNIFIANDYRLASYKSSKQNVICLNYWIAPMKGTFYGMNSIGLKSYLSLVKSKNTLIDFFITTSDFCSWTVSCAHAITLSRLLPLGFPRDDVFYGGKVNVTKDDLSRVLGFSPEHIICYTPTHRDFENQNRRLFEKESVKGRTLFGNKSVEDDAPLETLLEETNSIIIAKAHYAQESSVVNKFKGKRILYFDELKAQININLHEIYKMSDLLITDYSSAFYDFLCLDRPVLYYMYDYDKYIETRGLWIDPIEPFIAGPLLTSFESLIDAIRNTLNGSDGYVSKRKFVRDMVDKNQDGYSAERIKEKFLRQ